MKRVVLILSLWLALGLCFGVVHLDISGYSGINAPNPLDIESYVEDNDEVVHPDVIYFENGWNGYAYWMAFTPFANSNAQYENPSIAVSHDGLEWEIPPGLTNPVVAPFDETYNPNDYYHSDPDIIMSDDNSTMYLFWREHSGWRFETLKYVSSTDGINWSEPVSVLQVDGSSVERIISPAIIRDSDNYKMWTVNTKTTPRTINMRTSDNLIDSWSEPILTDLPMITSNSEIWHLDVLCVDDKYYMLASVGAAGTPRGGDLYLVLSENGINWEVSATPALSGNDNSWDKLLYRSTLIANPVNNHLNFKVWYSCDGGTATDNLYWKIGYTEFTHPDTPNNVLPSDLVISEVMYANSSLTGAEFIDEYGEQSDWIELHNRGTEAVDIADYFLSNDSTNLTKWRVPEGVIAPNERIVIWCNEQDALYNNSLNTNFELADNGESVYLTFVDHITIIDSVSAIEIPANYSFGRASFDDHFFNVLANPTPGTANEVQDSPISVIVTEVMSNNRDFMHDEDGDSSDWIEIRNDGLFPMNLSYFSLSDDSNELTKWQFAHTSLLPNEYRVVWASGKDRREHTNFNITSSGAEITLTGKDVVQYSTVAIPALNLNESYALGESNWAISETPTPYQDNLFLTRNNALFINEVMTNGLEFHLDANGVASDWIELFNNSDEPLDLSGMYLSNDWHNYTKWTFPELTLPAGAVVLIWCSGDDTIYADNETHTNFSISSHGAELLLVDVDGLNILNTFYAYPTLEDISLGRFPNGVGAIYEYLTPSPNLPNPAPQLPEMTLYINEVMASNNNYFYDINENSGSWFELINYGSESVELRGLHLSNDLNNLDKWQIPAQTLLPNEIILFWADSSDNLDSNYEFHTNFELTDSQTLYLTHIDATEVIDSVSCAVSGVNASMARKWDDMTLWEETLIPTPNNSNELSYNLHEAIFINEVCSNNQTIITDSEGNYSSWIELWNQKDYPINLRGFSLTDELTNLDKWVFPTTRLEANSYILIWCTGTDALYPNGEMHTNFNLSASGDDLTLSFINSDIVDDLSVNSIPADNSFGRLVENTAHYALFTIPSPGAENISEGATDNLDAEVTTPLTYLINNYPNPFNPETTISFNLKDSGVVRLEIYNIKGQKVRTLLNEHKEAGNHNIIWNGTDDHNRKVASGVYLYKMRNGRFSSTKKMILMK